MTVLCARQYWPTTPRRTARGSPVSSGAWPNGRDCACKSGSASATTAPTSDSTSVGRKRRHAPQTTSYPRTVTSARRTSASFSEVNSIPFLFYRWFLHQLRSSTQWPGFNRHKSFTMSVTINFSIVIEMIFGYNYWLIQHFIIVIIVLVFEWYWFSFIRKWFDSSPRPPAPPSLPERKEWLDCATL